MYKKWLKIAIKIAAANDKIDKAVCPTCGENSVDYLYVGNPLERIGYLQVWCNSCKHGIYVSRAIIPQNVKMLSFEDEEKIKKAVCHFTIIPPD